MTTPTMNAEMLYDLIAWAEFDQDELTKPLTLAERFARWGHWGQGAWSIKTIRQPMTMEQAQVALSNGACQTSYCMAGQAVVQSHYRIIYTDRYDIAQDGVLKPDQQLIAEFCIRQIESLDPTTGLTTRVDDPTAERRYISDVAQEVLGLDYDEASRFFEANNDLDDLKQMVNGFCDTRRLPLLYPTHGIWEDPDDDDDYEDEDEDEATNY